MRRYPGPVTSIMRKQKRIDFPLWPETRCELRELPYPAVVVSRYGSGCARENVVLKRPVAKVKRAIIERRQRNLQFPGKVARRASQDRGVLNRTFNRFAYEPGWS